MSIDLTTVSRVLSVQKAAEVSGLSPRTIYRMLDMGMLEKREVPPRYYVTERSLKQWLETGEPWKVDEKPQNVTPLRPRRQEGVRV